MTVNLVEAWVMVIKLTQTYWGNMLFFDLWTVHFSSNTTLYHAGMAHKDLEYILKEIPRSNNVKHLVNCTISFGIGIHIPDIDLIIHQGAWTPWWTIGKRLVEQPLSRWTQGKGPILCNTWISMKWNNYAMFCARAHCNLLGTPLSLVRVHMYQQTIISL